MNFLKDEIKSTRKEIYNKIQIEEQEDQQHPKVSIILRFERIRSTNSTSVLKETQTDLKQLVMNNKTVLMV